MGALRIYFEHVRKGFAAEEILMMDFAAEEILHDSHIHPPKTTTTEALDKYQVKCS